MASNLHLESRGELLVVRGLDRLTADNCQQFKEMVRGSLAGTHKIAEVDLSSATAMDSAGCGALIAIQKTMRERGGFVRLRHPMPLVSELLRLLHMERVFEVVEQ
jgi:anti-sigma B factor antagonist